MSSGDSVCGSAGSSLGRPACSLVLLCRGVQPRLMDGSGFSYGKSIPWGRPGASAHPSSFLSHVSVSFAGLSVMASLEPFKRCLKYSFG